LTFVEVPLFYPETGYHDRHFQACPSLFIKMLKNYITLCYEILGLFISR